MRRSILAVALLAVGFVGCGSQSGRADAPAAKQQHAARPRVKYVSPHVEPVPILMFHVIAVALPGARYPELYDAPATFAAQMHWLAANGFTAVTMQRLWRYWRYGDALPRHPIVLTFDDGYRGDWASALPILSALHWPGVLNLQIGNLEQRHVRRLLRAGWEVDVHTFTHPNLTTVDAAQLQREVGGARSWIRRVFGVPASFFAYPSGRYDAVVVAAVRRAGFLAAETTNEGYARPSDGRFTLDRIRVNGNAGVVGLAAALANRK
ncbi:MAG: polysaccharide deacetylase family protein [Gaiellaceae bacterium]